MMEAKSNRVDPMRCHHCGGVLMPLTTIDRQTANEAGVAVAPRADQYVRTGNGVIRVSSARADELSIGDIVRHDVALQVADSDDLNVLGMNYLSTLKRWGVEGRWLILVS